MAESERIIVDRQTGEYVTDLNPGDRIIRKKIIDQLQEQDGERMPFAPETWGKTYDGTIQKLATLKLSSAEYQLILFVLPLIKIGSGLLVYGNFKAVQLDYIMQELKMSSKTAKQVVQRLVNLRILYRGESGKTFQYFFNPYIYSRGSYINATLKDMFKDSMWADNPKHQQSKSGYSYYNNQKNKKRQQMAQLSQK